eukprot:2903283-Prymnesium_polylepis.1
MFVLEPQVWTLFLCAAAVVQPAAFACMFSSFDPLKRSGVGMLDLRASPGVARQPAPPCDRELHGAHTATGPLSHR